MMVVRHPLFPAARCAEAIADARAFFALPDHEKQAAAIERSPHFRGYSQMYNSRDWREQIHFGREEVSPLEGPVYQTLRGPNLWPGCGAWRSRMLQLMRDLEQAGRDILSSFGAGAFLHPAEEPYLLLKLIHYPVPPDQISRSGVAPHVDFSWITLVLQDNTGGLEIRTPEGKWVPAPFEEGTLLVNMGEILQYATGGRFQATPHRVVNRSAQSRVSMPFFLNPALDTTVYAAPAAPENPDPEHVHRVLSGPQPTALHFGEAEWRRKGLGIWCSRCVPG